MPKKWDFSDRDITLEQLKAIIGAFLRVEEPPIEVDFSANVLNSSLILQEGTSFIARYLSCNPPLEVLDLGCTNTSSYGVEALIKGLETNTHLRQLRLSNNGGILQAPMQRLYEEHKKRVPDFKLITHDPHVTVTEVEIEPSENDSSSLFKEKKCK